MKKPFITYTLVRLVLLFGLPFMPNQLEAQCPDLKGSFNFTIPCGNSCTNLSFKVPNFKSSTTYSVVNIPYAPFPANTGTPLPSLYTDDSFSVAINLQFPFCFYDNTYNQVVIGSNSILTFDLNNANQPCGFILPAPIPFTGYAGASIMGPYHDIDASPVNSPANRRIEWSVQGTAPCRRFVVSYSNVAMWSCNGPIATSQIILYERSGFIDVQITNKPICIRGSGLAILGVQNLTQTAAVAAPNKNCTQWSETNTAYRFVPNGTTLLQNVRITKKDGTLVGTGTTGANTGDSITVTYNNYCLPENLTSDTLVVKANYNSCTGLASQAYTLTDTIYINKMPSALPATAIATASDCSGTNGAITVTIPTGTGISPFLYSLNGGPFQNGNTFTGLAPGNYTVRVREANRCTKYIPITVPLVSNLLLDTRRDTTICESKRVALTTISNGATFKWTPGNTLSDSTIQNPVAQPQVTTKYYITAYLGICSKKDSVTVFVNPAPTPNAGNDTTICYADAISLHGSGGVQFEWNPNYSINFPNTANPLVTPLKTTKYLLSVIDNFGCKSLLSDTVIINVVPKVIVLAGNDTLVAPGQPVQLHGVANAPGFLWTPSSWLSNAAIANPVATIPTLGHYVYLLKAFTPEGCYGTDTLKIKVYKGPEIYVPTGFTPNNDGKNDLLKVIAVGLKEFHYFRVFNRWGQLVFQTTNPDNGWNGFFNGKEQPGDVYVWLVGGVSYLNDNIQKKGTVVLIR